jgi:hypothetical protein
MNQLNKIKLNELIAQSKKMYTDADTQAFAIKWRTFLDSLDQIDGKIACEAYFAAIYETLDKIEEDVKDLVENGTEQERLDYSNLLEELKAPLLSTKLRAAA